jgi:Tfp pilus assembly protein PilO
MANVLDRLNLAPRERRILLAVGLILFAVLNLVFIWPMLPDWKQADTQIEKSRKTLADYRLEIAQVATNRTRLQELEQQGSTVLREEQALDLVRTIQRQAADSGVNVTRTQPGVAAGSSTNRYFDEQSVFVDVTTKDEELVQFLYALGSGDSMIRVRQLDLKPDPPQYRLIGKLELVASYLKKSPPPAAATPAQRPTATTNAPPARIVPTVNPGRTNRNTP